MSKVDLDFIGVGPQRTGTTWLDEVLRQHPALCLPEQVKETMFFDRRYGRGLEWYVQYFDKCDEDQLYGEVAPTYFDIPDVPERIYEVAPDCEIIITLRHPVERAFSLYIHHLKKGRVARNFQQAIRQKPRIVTAGHYARHISRWQTAFGDEQIHFLFLDDIKSNPKEVLDQAWEYLGIKPIHPPARTGEKVNVASLPRFPLLARAAALFATFFHSLGMHKMVQFGKKLGLKEFAYSGREEEMPEMSPDDRDRLLRKYNEDIVFVEEVTGRNLPKWRE